MGTCTFSKEKVVAQVKGYHDLARGDENQLKEALATVGPVSVAIDAGRSGFRSYKSGECLLLPLMLVVQVSVRTNQVTVYSVLLQLRCSRPQLNHIVAYL